MRNEDSALVLQGGSLRSLFTAGVLDVLIENGIEFPYVNGVSAGSLCAMNYISKQVGRTKNVNVRYLHDKDYIGISNMLRGKGLFNFDYLFHYISKDDPFDWETFEQSNTRYVAVATNIQTCQAEYLEKKGHREIELSASASSSLPLVNPPVKLDGKEYLDGGLSDPVAYEEALRQGYHKRVVILTRERGYRKKRPSKQLMKLYCAKYGNHPQLLQTLIYMWEDYNRMMDDLEEREGKGVLFVIRPVAPVDVKRVERDPKKLQALYREGRLIAEQQIPDVKTYLELY